MPTPKHPTLNHIVSDNIAVYRVDAEPRLAAARLSALSPPANEVTHRQVSLFRNGANQALRIPKEFELPGTAAWVYRDGPRLVIEPIATPAASLALAMQGWDDINDADVEAAFFDIDAGLLPLDDVVL